MTRARSLSRLANTNAFTVDASNRVGIGSTQPDVRLDVNGDMNVTGTLTYEDVTNVETAGITTTGGLVVTGLGATIGGITTFFGDINFGAAGVGGTITTLGHAEFAGIVTASSFRGDGSQLSGVDSSNLVDSGDTNRVAANTSGVVITGITTTTNTVKAADGHVELLLDSGNGRIKLNNSSDTTNIDLFGSNGSATFKGDLTIADKIIHDGDTDTAIRFPAANTFTAETAGSERLRITSSGQVVVGDDASRNNYDNGSVTSNLLHVERTAASGNAGISICANAATAADVGAILYMGRTSATSNGGNTIVESGDLIGRISFQGADGSELVEAASIKVDVDGTPGSNDMPGRMEFHTTADGGSGSVERLRIDSSGNIRIMTSNGQLKWTASSGNDPFIRSIGSGQQSLEFNTGATERLRLDSSGRLKIGTISDYSAAVTNAPVYISMQSDITGIGDDEGDTTAGMVRIEETGSNDGRFHGIELRNKNSGDIRIFNSDQSTLDRGDLILVMPDEDANDGTHLKMRVNSLKSSIQISGKGGAIAGNAQENHTDIYIATKTGMTAVNTGLGAEVAGLIRFEDKGTNNNRYHGIEIRNRNSGDARILNLDEGTTNKANLVFAVDNGTTVIEALRINSDGDLLPGANDTYDLGSTSKRWANIFTADLQLSNESKKDTGGNDVDGTWGDYTIQEGESDLFLLNKRNGKKFKFMLQEVS